MNAQPIDTSGLNGHLPPAGYVVGLYQRQPALDPEFEPGYDVWSYLLTDVTDVRQVLDWTTQQAASGGADVWSVSVRAQAGQREILIAGTVPIEAP